MTQKGRTGPEVEVEELLGLVLLVKQTKNAYLMSTAADLSLGGESG